MTVGENDDINGWEDQGDFEGANDGDENSHPQCKGGDIPHNDAEPHQLAPTVGTTGVGSTGSPVPSTLQQIHRQDL
jgi:hypothetical protein